MPLASVTSVMESLKRESLNLRLPWSFNRAMSQLGTTSETPMRRRKSWSLLSRHLKKSCFLIQTTSSRDPVEMRSRTKLRCTKEFLLKQSKNDDFLLARVILVHWSRVLTFNSSSFFLLRWCDVKNKVCFLFFEQIETQCLTMDVNKFPHSCLVQQWCIYFIPFDCSNRLGSSSYSNFTDLDHREVARLLHHCSR